MAHRITVSAVSTDFLILDPARSDEQNVEQVHRYLAGLLDQVLADRPDLVVLPEVCDRPDNFEMPRRSLYYQCRGERILDFFRQTARDNRCWILYPTERRDDAGAWHNAAWLIDRQGGIAGVYDKMFVTLSQMEEDGFACADKVPLLETEFGTVGMAICFDLNFLPMLATYARRKPDIVLFPSHFHGSIIAEYWAYASRAWFVGAIARHECYVVAPTGAVVARSGPGRRCITASINLDRCVVHCEWADLGKLESLKQRYGNGVGVTEAGFGGNYLVTSEIPQASAEAMVHAAGLTTLDDHLRLRGRGSPAGREEGPEAAAAQETRSEGTVWRGT